MSHEPTDARRRVPSIDRLLEEPPIVALTRLYGREQVRVQVRTEVAGRRIWLAGRETAGDGLAAAIESLPDRITEDLRRRLGGPYQGILNATGIFLHSTHRIGAVQRARDAS